MIIRYHGSDTQVLLGDHVQFRSLFIFKKLGRAVYVPGISPEHKEMEGDEYSLLSVEYGDRRMISWPIFRGRFEAPKALVFVRRSTEDFKGLQPGEDVL